MNRKKDTTRGEAIAYFKRHLDLYCVEGISRESEEMAIKALEQEPCEDAINRQAVLDLIEHYNSDGLGSVFNGYEEGVKFADAVNKLSPVTPQQKTGHWIGKKIIDREWKDYIVPLKDGFVTSSCSCSECGEWLTASDEYACYGRYCPNCGAKMESEDKE